MLLAQVKIEGRLWTSGDAFCILMSFTIQGDMQFVDNSGDALCIACVFCHAWLYITHYTYNPTAHANYRLAAMFFASYGAKIIYKPYLPK